MSVGDERDPSPFGEVDPRVAGDAAHERGAVRAALLSWFDRERRDLPWRRTTDAYAIWVSEVMLQQTRVETVIPYYERFLARFPTADALARATEDEVLSMWSGLGYYRRARWLHAGVREVATRYGGRVPEDAAARRALPGVGRYTAGAIGSIAFGLEEPLVDGNVARVLTRFYGIETPLGHRETEARLWREAEHLVRGPRPGDLNQALMELGATVCGPSSPRCLLCPLRAPCVARGTGRTDELPRPKSKKAPKIVHLVAAIVADGEELILVRSDAALFGGLYGPPTAELASGDVREDELFAAARAALGALGIDATCDEEIGHVAHVLTHRRLEARIVRARLNELAADSPARRVRPDALSSVGVSSWTRKLLGLAPSSRSREGCPST